MFTGVWVICPVCVLQASVVHASLSVTETATCFGPVAASHESTVHALLSSIWGGAPGTQFPLPSHFATPSQTVELSQLVLFATKVFLH